MPDTLRHIVHTKCKSFKIFDDSVVHADGGTVFYSVEGISDCQQRGVNVSFAVT